MGQSSDSRDAGSFAPRPSRSAAERTSVQALDQFREKIHRRLDQIQDLARERRAVAADDDRVAEWSRRIEELEQALEEAKSAARRAERERVASLEKLEQDRALLAEAWERLERERVESDGRASIATPANPPPRTASPGLISPQSAPVRSGSGGPGDDSVERAVFQQFQALRRDVRRKADSRIVD